MKFAKVTEVTTNYYQSEPSGGKTLHINIANITYMYRTTHNPYPVANSKSDQIEVTALILLPQGDCIKVLETIDQILGDI